MVNEDHKILQGDCLHRLRELADDSVDLICTDPPYGLKLLDKDWDQAVPGVDQFRECLRVLKPGGLAFVMSHPRLDLQAAMALHLKEAGFKIGFTPVYWCYGTGYTKAKNLGKKNPALEGIYSGFNPKPAVEVVIVAMKPCSENTYYAQVQKNGGGVMHTEESRIPGEVQHLKATRQADYPQSYRGDGAGWGRSRGGHAGDKVDFTPHEAGRFPANLIVSDEMLGEFSRYFDLDSWSNERLPFIYAKRPTRAERQKGCEDIEGGNDHVSVKPMRLMAWLICLGSKRGDLILDPFAGSGSTIIAAKLIHRRAIGIELDERNALIAQARVKAQEPLELKEAED